MKSRTDFILGTFCGVSLSMLSFCLLPKFVACALVGFLLLKSTVMFFLVRKEERAAAIEEAKP